MNIETTNAEPPCVLLYEEMEKPIIKIKNNGVVIEANMRTGYRVNTIRSFFIIAFK